MSSIQLSALLWGAISAVSLPLGALVGIYWRPHSKVLSTLMAFGAGALLFALTVELLGRVPELVEEIGLRALIAGVTGALAGGLVFDLLNQALNNRGAFLRNLSNAKEYVARTKRRRAERLLKRLSRLEAFASVPPEELADLVKHVKRRKIAAGETVFEAGDAADALYFVRRGKIAVRAPGAPEQRVVEHFDSFGELGVLSHVPRTTTAKAIADSVLYVLEEDDLESASASSETIRHALVELAAHEASKWRYRELDPRVERLFEEAEDDLGEMNMPVEEADYREERDAMKQAAGVGMAIWLGIAIDAVPESLVIGTLAMSAEGMSIAFIVGVFLANFPEAMSSSVSMRKAGMSRRRVLVMWSSLCVLTAVGAVIGTLLFASVAGDGPSTPLVFVEALAAGAMLTAIAETMLPEAFEQGGSIVGMATLTGFLAALVAASL